MKLSDALRDYAARGCPPIPDHCGDHESPGDPYTQVCQLNEGHRGDHHDVDDWPR